jgi:protein SCO1
MRSALFRLCALALAFLLGACARNDGATLYPLSGKIEALDIFDRELTIAHQEIPGYMPGMTMPFKLRPSPGRLARYQEKRIEQLRRGDVITATLAVTATESWVENVRVVRYEAPPEMPVAVPKESKIGGQVIDVLFEDQDGKPLRFADYRGHVLALTFIYTRCPLPDFCPLIMKNFQQLDEAIEKDKDLRTNARLLSLSFDVEFDRPEVLNAFGSAFVKDRGQGPFARWKLATGTKEAIDRIGRFFGLVFFKEDGQFAHSLVTVVLDKEGKVVQEFSGNDWSVEEALEAMKAASGTRPSPSNP